MITKHLLATLKNLPIFVAFLSLWFLATACNIGQEVRGIVQETTDRTLPVLDSAIDRLDSQSSDWQVVMQDTVDQLTRDGQSTIANEVRSVMTHGIATGGVELRCDADFMRVRMQQDLERIKAKLLGQTVDPRNPAFCQVDPLSVDVALVETNRLKTLVLYGYDLDTKEVKAYMGKEDVSKYLDRPTHYHMTLNLTGIGSDKLRANDKLVFRWAKEELASVAITKPVAQPCKILPDYSYPQTIDLIPEKVKNSGDLDFQSHGPKVTIQAKYVTQGGPGVGAQTQGLGTKVDIVVSMRAEEWENGARAYDYSHGFITKTISKAYEAKSGYVIQRIKGAAETNFSYVDNNWGMDGKFTGQGPVDRVECYGDNEGADVGSRTQCKIFFKKIEVDLIQTGDCKR